MVAVYRSAAIFARKPLGVVFTQLVTAFLLVQRNRESFLKMQQSLVLELEL